MISEGSCDNKDWSNSIQVYLYSAFHDTNRCKAALQKILSFYIIFRSRLLVVTMAEMYSKNHAVSYRLHVIKQTVNTINCNDYMLRLNFAIKQNLVVLYVVPGLALVFSNDTKNWALPSQE